MKASKAQIKTINRLSAQAVFDSLRQTKDVRWVATGLIVQVQPRPADLPGAYGLCVSASKKTAPRAVDRNRIRRRLKAIAVEVLPLVAKPGLNYMITGRAQALTRPITDLHNDLRWCLKKLDLLQEAPSDAG